MWTKYIFLKGNAIKFFFYNSKTRQVTTNVDGI